MVQTVDTAETKISKFESNFFIEVRSNTKIL